MVLFLDIILFIVLWKLLILLGLVIICVIMWFMEVEISILRL